MKEKIGYDVNLWEKIFQEHEWGKYPAIPVVRFIAKNFYQIPFLERRKIKILEIGSGTGANLWFCAREGFSVIALEGSQTAINRMIERFRYEHLIPFLLEAKVGNYLYTIDEIEDNSIDVIIDCESLSCNTFDIARKVIEKCFKKLKTNGKMLSITIADGTWGMQGPECDYHAVIPTEGPLAGKGFVRYTTYEDIQKLYKLDNNIIEKIERQDYYYSEKNVVKEWIIELRKI